MVKKKHVANKIFRIWENGVCLTTPELIQRSGAAFFRIYLHGTSLCSIVLTFWGFTATTIMPIPKVDGAHSSWTFIPSVFYKIVSKLLYSRLSTVEERLISMNQSGFILGRLISDNILLAQELNFNLPTCGGNVILKLDMAKAYDRIQWPFLLDALQKFRHGDPFSPLFFILGTECFSCGLDRLYLQYLDLRATCLSNTSEFRYFGVTENVRFLSLSCSGFARGWKVVQPPVAFLEKLELAFNGFLWGSRPLKKKWHCPKLSRACLPVDEGGLASAD
ncbi:uncharacterized protein [Primulina eburnea]|uniref:uncharacterized protein n=1 Tax=Primulina eburnea TaxID=1245227 RepID=UPI003C6C8A59